MKRAFVFPGQGAQVVGMGKDIYEKYEEARNVYDLAEKITGMDIKNISFEGPEEELMKTRNTQIAILTNSLAITEVLKSKNIDAKISCGLSLGEYTALIYSGVISFEEGIDLIKKRGQYMGELLPKEEYAMAAVLSLDSSIIEEVCSEIRAAGKFVVPANYNCQAQTVISGELEAIDIAAKELTKRGAKRVLKLKTSGPFHTEKLVEAKLAFEKELELITINDGDCDVIKNVDGTKYTRADDVKEILGKHMVSPVRFDKTIELMKNEEIEEYIEIGPGKVLSGFIKKDNKEANIVNIYDAETLEKYLNK